MSSAYGELQAPARNFAQGLLQALARMPLEAIAEAIGKDESVACRIRTGEARLTVHEFCALADAAGKKLVGKDKVCIKRELLEAIALLNASLMQGEGAVLKIVHEDEG